MSNAQPTLVIKLSKSAEHLVFTKTKFEDGFETERKTGILAIAPDRDPDEMLEVAHSYNWILGNEKENGFYSVKRGAKLEPAE